MDNLNDNIVEKDFGFNIFQTTKETVKELEERGIDEIDCIIVKFFADEFNDLTRFIEGELK